MSAETNIYRHAKREEWGYAILVEELVDRTSFYFDHAGLKTFTHDFVHLVEVADLPEAEGQALLKRLGPKRPRKTSASQPVPGRPKKARQPTFPQQIERFVARYPAGFEDAQYVADERTVVDAAIAEAAKSAEGPLADAALAAADAAAFDGIVALLKVSRKLTAPSTPKKVAGIAEELRPGLCTALHAVIYGDGPYPARFDTWVKTLKVSPRPDWPMASVLPALFHPQAHVLVRRTAFRTQAGILGMPSKSEPMPTGPAYAGTLEIARRTETMLEEAGHKPRDLWDVLAFIRITTAKPAPAAKAAKPEEPAAPIESAASAETAEQPEKAVAED